MERLIAFPAALLLTISATPGQQPILSPRVAPAAVAKAVGVRHATLQDLTLPENARQSFRMSLRIASRDYTLQLRPKKLLDCNFKLLIGDGDALRELPAPRDTSYHGEILGVPGSSVALSLFGGQVRGLVMFEGNSWGVEPLQRFVASADPRTHVVYAGRDATGPNLACGVKDTVEKRPLDTGVTPQSNTIAECEIAFDIEHQYFVANGRDTNKTMADVNSIMNVVDTVYRRDLAICYKITRVLIRTTQLYPSNVTDAQALLNAMESQWRTNHRSIPRDVAHMFSSRQPTGPGGVARGGICSDPFSVSVLTPRTLIFFSTTLVAHELGHNWGAGHCPTGPGCYTMCRSAGLCAGETRFGQASINSITALRNRVTCLGQCGGCRGNASYTTFPATDSQQCKQDNWTQSASTRSTTPVGQAFLLNSGPTGLVIESVDFELRSSAAQQIFVSIRDRGTNGAPRATLGSAWMNTSTTRGVSTARFSTPVTIAPNTRFFIALTSLRSNWEPPYATGGTSIETWREDPFRGFVRANNEFWRYRIHCATGCRGTGFGAEACAAANWDLAQGGFFFGTGRIAMFVANTQQTSIDSVEFKMSARVNSNVTVPVEIWSSASGQPGTMLGATTMTIGPTRTIYRATFAQRPNVRGDYFVVIRNNMQTMLLPLHARDRGVAIPSWLNFGSRWTQLNGHWSWIFRVHCWAGNREPKIWADAPRLGQAYNVYMRSGRAGALAVLFHAAAPQAIDLGLAGAPGCFLYVGGIFDVTPRVVDPQGRATFAHAIPNIPAICGVPFMQQVVVQDPTANAVGWVLSRRGQPVIGN